MQPGRTYTLVEHPDDRQNGAYALVELVHRGTASPTAATDVDYTNTFACVPGATPFPLPYPERRNVVSNVTATVITESGDTAYSRGMGEVKVQFHWDREDRDPHGSCWLRCMNAWAGTHWGTQFIPRAGMEVVIAFEGGDPDKPFVLGSLYNGSQPPPFPLPQERLRSGIRTNSSSGNYNELSFFDQSGHEQILLRAGRDMVTDVIGTYRRSTGADEFLGVKSNRHDTVGEDYFRNVAGAEHIVAGSRTLETRADHHFSVGGRATNHFFGPVRAQYDKDVRIEVSGSAKRLHHGDVDVKVRGSHTMVVGEHNAARSYELHVEGASASYASRRLELRSDNELVLTCGASTLRLTPKGIELESPRIACNGSATHLRLDMDGLHMRAEDTLLRLASQRVVMRTDQATLSMGSEVRIDALQILLNSPDWATDEQLAAPEPPTVIELVDGAGTPVPHRRYAIVLDDGTEITGTTDDKGRARVELGRDAVVCFPDLSQVEPASLGMEDDS